MGPAKSQRISSQRKIAGAIEAAAGSNLPFMPDRVLIAKTLESSF